LAASIEVSTHVAPQSICPAGHGLVVDVVLDVVDSVVLVDVVPVVAVTHEPSVTGFETENCNGPLFLMMPSAKRTL
jgi:hypothetical protein